MRLPHFYPIFDHSDWLARLLPAGIQFTQLRIKNQPAEVIQQEIQRSKALCAQYSAILVVNDYWQAAIDAQVDWVHLGQEDLDDADIRSIRRHGINIGVSTHDDDELERVLTMAPDYIALGPVYPTTTKKMKWHQQGLGKVQEWRQRVGEIPLVAIGGLSVERAAAVYAAGADVISVISDVTLHPDPALRVKEWLEVGHD